MAIPLFDALHLRVGVSYRLFYAPIISVDFGYAVVRSESLNHPISEPHWTAD
jgi:hypothetical protein